MRSCIRCSRRPIRYCHLIGYQCRLINSWISELLLHLNFGPFTAPYPWRLFSFDSKCEVVFPLPLNLSDSPRVGVLGLLETAPTLRRGTDILPADDDIWRKTSDVNNVISMKWSKEEVFPPSSGWTWACSWGRWGSSGLGGVGGRCKVWWVGGESGSSASQLPTGTELRTEPENEGWNTKTNPECFTCLMLSFNWSLIPFNHSSAAISDHLILLLYICNLSLI